MAKESGKKIWDIGLLGVLGSGSRIVENVGWLFVDRGVAILNALVIGAYVARYLGAEGVGILGVFASSNLMLVPVVTLGLDRILVREFVQKPEQKACYFWTVSCIKIIVSLVVWSIASILWSSLGSYSNSLVWWALLPVFLTSGTGLILLLESELRSKFYVWTRAITVFFEAGIKVFLVINHADIIWFFVTHGSGIILHYVILSGFMRVKKILPSWRMPSFEITKALFFEVWPLSIGTISLGVFMHLDILMVHMLVKNESETGLYFVATRFSGLWHFVPLVIASSFFPKIAEGHSRWEKKNYYHHLLNYLKLNSLFAYVLVFISLLVSPVALRFLYGVEFEGAVQIFYIHIFCLIFWFQEVARNQYCALERIHIPLSLAIIIGLIVNIMLNLYLIPKYGGLGAASATLLSFSITSIGTSFLLPKLQNIGLLQMKSLLHPCPEPEAR